MNVDDTVVGEIIIEGTKAATKSKIKVIQSNPKPSYSGQRGNAVVGEIIIEGTKAATKNKIKVLQSNPKPSYNTSGQREDAVVGENIVDGTKAATKNKIKVLQSNPKPSYNTSGQSRRRKVFKKNKTVYKAPRAVSVPVPTDRVSYGGSFFTKGDVVSLIDDQQRVYYAQIRGLLQDQYCEKSAVITWLLPTQSSPKGRFDAATYIIGPEEEFPRTLDCLEFVCHSPSEYYLVQNPPHPEVPEKPVCGFAWTSKGPKIVSLPAEEFNTDSE